MGLVQIRSLAPRILTLSILISLAPITSYPSFAATVIATGTNPSVCNQTVGDATNVIAYRLSGGDCVIEFKNTGTTTWDRPTGVTTVRVLVVGGGGGGASRHAGGGGGGGVVEATSYVVSGTVGITVGTGGSAGINQGKGTSGTDSRFFLNSEASAGATGIVAKGGGFGDFYTTSGNAIVRAGSGGSGGGTGVPNPFTRDLSPGYSNADPTGLTIQSSQTQRNFDGTTLSANMNQYGNNGAQGGLDGYWAGGGGGGAGGVGSRGGGAAGTNYTGGAGGAGIESLITSTSRFFGGGGGGGGGTGGTSYYGPESNAQPAAPTNNTRSSGSRNYGSSATNNAAFAAGMSSAASSSTLGDTLFGMSTAAVDPDNPDNKNMTHEQRAAARLRRWQMTMGIQSLGYGLEDIYYSGARGALNNLPFAAQGLAAFAGVNPEKAERISGVTALLATGAMVAYDNREGLAKSAGIDLGKREDKIMGVIPNFLGMPDLSDTQAAQKKVTDAMYYVDKYGEKSNEGKKYKEEAIKAMVDVQSAQARDTSPAEIARVRSLPSVEAMSSGEILGRTGLGGDRTTANLAQSKAVSESSASQISKALSGDPKAISALQQDIKDNKLTGRDMTMAQSVINMGGKMSAFDAKRIESLRASASNPYADVKSAQGMIQGIMQNNGASEEDAAQFAGGMGQEMQEMQKRAPQNWQASFDMNKDRYVANIAASLGGIQANGSRGNARASQTNNLKGQIYSDLVNSGVPANKARELANQLYMEGNGQFRGRMDAASGANNGMNQMQNFMGMLGDEQQMAFGQFQQNRMQIQMHQAMLRRQQLMRSRFGLRGNR